MMYEFTHNLPDFYGKKMINVGWTKTSPHGSVMGGIFLPEQKPYG